jgi:nucleoside-diphosphate-sugar epimerase
MKALVTGGGGFLGKAIVRALAARGDEAVSFSRGKHPSLAALGVEERLGDIASLEALTRASRDCDVVFHVAAKAGIWGSFEEYRLANLLGTQNVIAACQINSIARLIYTSSPSVVFDGSDIEGGNESLPYPSHFQAHYPHTKALAEQAVLCANSPTLATIALRPHLIWGPGDNHLAPRLIARARAGKLRRIGGRPCLVDTVYLDNAAEAHLNASDRLAPGSLPAGKAYFISNGEPRPLWEMVNGILTAAGLPPENRMIPATFAYVAGAICEQLWSTLHLSGEPPMTRFAAKELATAHWFDISAAKNDLGYRPRVTIDQGLRRLQEWFAKGGQ